MRFIAIIGCILHETGGSMDQADRALGSLLGLCTGDAFGSQGEFEKQQILVSRFPFGFSEMDSKSRPFGEAGMVTDDSEMAVILAHSIAEAGVFDVDMVRASYQRWMALGPLDIGSTVRSALSDGTANATSQANGALMRSAAIAIVGSQVGQQRTIAISDAESAITHAHPICRDANRLWTLTAAQAIKDGLDRHQAYAYMKALAQQLYVDPILVDAIDRARTEAPQRCDGPDQGWVVIALHLGLYTLLHADSFEEGVRSITMRGGDADTNAAIYATLGGAIFGAGAIPPRWIASLRPSGVLIDLFGDQATPLSSFVSSLVTSLLAIR